MPEERPETKYAKTSDGVHVAYQVTGAGPLDLWFGWGGGGSVTGDWEWPQVTRFIERLGSFSRLVRIDARGSGVSDPIPSLVPTLEEQAKDMTAVLDVIGSQQAALFANNIAGLPAMFFAASFPERTAALVLDGCYARYARAPDYPMGLPQHLVDRSIEVVQQQIEDGLHSYGTDEVAGRFGWSALAPKSTADPDFIAASARRARATQSPSVAKAMSRVALETDVRPLLAAIRAPTLVVCRRDDPFAGPRHSEYLAEHIAGARLVVLPGEENLSFVGDTDALLGEVQEFLTGDREVPDLDRVLATVLFSDIVRSTDQVAAVGDRKWRELLDRHDELVQAAVERFRGRFVKSTGDGSVATFDGPARAIRCAQAVARGTSGLGLEVRTGLHTGEVETRGSDLHGLAVHIAQRVCGHAGAGETLVSRTVVDLVAGSGIEFDERGDHELKGVPGSWPLFRVLG